MLSPTFVHWLMHYSSKFVNCLESHHCLYHQINIKQVITLFIFPKERDFSFIYFLCNDACTGVSDWSGLFQTIYALNTFKRFNYLVLFNVLNHDIQYITKYDTEIFDSWWRHQMEAFSALMAFVRGIHWSPLNSQDKGQWRGALMFSLICILTNGCVNNP